VRIRISKRKLDSREKEVVDSKGKSETVGAVEELWSSLSALLLHWSDSEVLEEALRFGDGGRGNGLPYGVNGNTMWMKDDNRKATDVQITGRLSDVHNN
jgi:hypothetical protein